MRIPKRLSCEVKEKLVLASNAYYDPQKKKPITAMIDFTKI